MSARLNIDNTERAFVRMFALGRVDITAGTVDR
jgi:hypothetical protein